jgi:hypothetical protein
VGFVSRDPKELWQVISCLETRDARCQSLVHSRVSVASPASACPALWQPAVSYQSGRWSNQRPSARSVPQTKVKSRRNQWNMQCRPCALSPNGNPRCDDICHMCGTRHRAACSAPLRVRKGGGSTGRPRLRQGGLVHLQLREPRHMGETSHFDVGASEPEQVTTGAMEVGQRS